MRGDSTILADILLRCGVCTDPNPTTITDTAIWKDCVVSDALSILRLRLYRMLPSCIALIARHFPEHLYDLHPVVAVFSGQGAVSQSAACYLVSVRPLHIHPRPDVSGLGLQGARRFWETLHAAFHVNITRTSRLLIALLLQRILLLGHYGIGRRSIY